MDKVKLKKNNKKFIQPTLFISTLPIATEAASITSTQQIDPIKKKNRLKFCNLPFGEKLKIMDRITPITIKATEINSQV